MTAAQHRALCYAIGFVRESELGRLRALVYAEDVRAEEEKLKEAARHLSSLEELRDSALVQP